MIERKSKFLSDQNQTICECSIQTDGHMPKCKRIKMSFIAVAAWSVSYPWKRGSEMEKQRGSGHHSVCGVTLSDAHMKYCDKLPLWMFVRFHDRDDFAEIPFSLVSHFKQSYMHFVLFCLFVCFLLVSLKDPNWSLSLEFVQGRHLFLQMAEFVGMENFFFFFSVRS